MKACLGWNHCSSRIPRGMTAIKYLWSENGLRAREEREREREGGREGGRDVGGKGR